MNLTEHLRLTPMAPQRALIALICGITTVVAAGPGFTVSGVPAQRPVAPKAPPHERDYGNTEIWPLPANAIPAADATLDPSTFSFILTPPTDPYLQEMTARAKDRILYYPNGTAAPGRQVLGSLAITVTDDSIRQVQEGVDESYSITCAPDGSAAFILAPTIFGARHAVESFSQMVNADRITGQYSVGCLNISEAPRFSHRGLLIDSARHWLNPNLLLAIMDGMSFNKMNALQVRLAYLLCAAGCSLQPCLPGWVRHRLVVGCAFAGLPQHHGADELRARGDARDDARDNRVPSPGASGISGFARVSCVSHPFSFSAGG